MKRLFSSSKVRSIVSWAGNDALLALLLAIGLFQIGICLSQTAGLVPSKSRLHVESPLPLLQTNALMDVGTNARGKEKS